MKDNIARQHIKIRNDLRKQFQQEQGSAADLLYESRKLFKPITETTEKIKKAIAAAAPQPLAAPQAIAAAPQATQPQAIELPGTASAAPAYAVIDPDQGLDIQAIEQMGFIRPSRLKDYDLYDDIIEKVGYYNKHVLGRAKRGSTSEEKDDINEKINANREYVKRLRLILSGQKLLVEGRGMPLKLVGNKFGNLTIDRNELDLGRLKASKNGTVVIDEAADRSLYNLLTKRYSKKHKYSSNALKMFKKLMELADIPMFRGINGCSKQSVVCGGAIYYSDPNDLVNRLQLLVASQAAGNTGLNNDISDIIDELLSKSYISKDVAIKLYNNLLQHI